MAGLRAGEALDQAGAPPKLSVSLCWRAPDWSSGSPWAAHIKAKKGMQSLRAEQGVPEGDRRRGGSRSVLEGHTAAASCA